MSFADIEFEKELFSAANKLRGKVAPSEYKYYVLPLIFIRYLSFRYELRRMQLEKLIRDESSEYFTKDQQIRDKILNDPNEYGKENVFYVPYEASWDYLLANADEPDIKVKLDNAMKLLEDTNMQLKGVLPQIYEKSNIPSEVVGALIKLFSREIFNQHDNRNVDLLGRTYEYFISNFASTEGNRGGEFFTPSSVVKLLVAMLEPIKGIVYDPACGTGGMFIQSKAYSNHKKDLSFVGQEQNEAIIRLAKMNGILHGIYPEIRQGDTLLNDRFPDLKADIVISNPPFNMRDWGADYVPKDDKRLIGPITNSNANYMWIQHFLYHLKEGGLAGFVIANGALTSNVAAEKQVRRKLVEEDYIDCVVQLPEKMFFTTRIPSALIFLSKNRDGSHGFRKRKGEILFIDASNKGKLINKKQRVFSDEEIEEIAKIYHAFKFNNEKPSDVIGFSKIVTTEEVLAQDCKLTPSLYVGTVTDKETDIPYQVKMKELKSLLEKQFKESNELQERIIRNLEGLI